MRVLLEIKMKVQSIPIAAGQNTIKVPHMRSSDNLNPSVVANTEKLYFGAPFASVLVKIHPS